MVQKTNLLEQGGRTFCSWRLIYTFIKTLGGHKKKSDTIIYILYNTQIIALQILILTHTYDG